MPVMNERLSETSQSGILNFLISSPSQVLKSVSVTVTCGSYTIVNNNFIFAAKLIDNPPTVDELLTPITPSDMGSLLTILVTEQDIVQDDDYYLSMINFEFENVQFLVPQWGFPESSTLKLSPDQEARTITWDDVSALDFRCLMEFMYPLDSLPLPPRHWVSVLKLSSLWHMYDYRRGALSRHVSVNLESDEKLVLGRLSGVPGWYREGCIELARGDSQLNASHQAIIGIDAMVKIARARDAAYRDTVVAYHKQFPDLASFAYEVPDSFVAEDDSSTSGSSVVDDVCTARANGLSKWLRCCYERLIDREESITLEEAATLGLETTIGIWKARLRLFQEYHHILKSTSDLNFSTHIETEFATELEEVRRLQDIFDPASSMSINSKSISMPMDDFFNPNSLYVIINLKFNTCLDGAWIESKVGGWKYDGATSQTWKFERTDSSYKIANASNGKYVSEMKGSKHLVLSEEPSTFFVDRVSSDESHIYGIFPSEFSEPTATAVRIVSKNGDALLDNWEGGKMEGSKWKIITVDEAKKYFGVA